MRFLLSGRLTRLIINTCEEEMKGRVREGRVRVGGEWEERGRGKGERGRREEEERGRGGGEREGGGERHINDDS